MSRLNLILLSVVSLAATVLVLTVGPGGDADDLSQLVAAQRPSTVAVPAPDAAASPVASEPAATDDPGADASDSSSSASAPVAAAASADVATAGGSGGSGGGSGGTGSAPAEDAPVASKVKHLFVVVLAGRGFEATFGAASPAAYLNGELRPKGVLLSGYRSLGAGDLADHIATIGGQPPNAETRSGCPRYVEIPPSVAPSATGEIAADGCVFPNTVITVADQLSSSRRTWRAYVEDLERGTPAKETCRHPESNGPDDTTAARPGDGYAHRHNPFVFFHSLLDLGECDANDGGLTRLEEDLRAADTTPSLSYIVPNLCNGGTDVPCVDGSPGGLVAADAFLATWAPKILASPAYKDGGALVVTFAGGGEEANGSLVVSDFAEAGTTVGGDHDPYSLLRSVQDLFALKPLARSADAPSFARSVLSAAFDAPAAD